MVESIKYALNKYSFIFAFIAIIIASWSLISAANIENFMRDNNCSDSTITYCKQILQYSSWIFLIFAILVINNITLAKLKLDKLWVWYISSLGFFLLLSLISSSIILSKIETCQVLTPMVTTDPTEPPIGPYDPIKSILWGQIIMNGVSLVIVIILGIIMIKFPYTPAGKIAKVTDKGTWYKLDKPEEDTYYLEGSRSTPVDAYTFEELTKPEIRETIRFAEKVEPPKKKKAKQVVLSFPEEDDE